MRRGLIVLVALLIAPAGASAARWGSSGWSEAHRLHRILLVTPTGHPVGGQMQRWADAAKVPTPPIRVTLYTDVTTICGPAESCSGGPPWYGAEYFIAANGREGLAWEMGHIYDWCCLGWGRRDRLRRIWGVPHARWRDTVAAVLNGDEDGLEGDFALAYLACASGETIGSVGLNIGIDLAPTCRFINSMRY